MNFFIYQTFFSVAKGKAYGVYIQKKAMRDFFDSSAIVINLFFLVTIK